MKTLIINNSKVHCGVHQYGLQMYEALKFNSKNIYTYLHCSDPGELLKYYLQYKPDCILFNYLPHTMKWLTRDILKKIKCLKIGTYHEVDSTKINHSFNLFDIELMLDPTFTTTDNRISMPRFLIDWYPYTTKDKKDNTTIISSFGFGTPQKGWVKLLQKVNNEYDNAIVRFNMPFNDIIDREGRSYALKTARSLRCIAIKSGITLEITHYFSNSTELLSWLSESTVNAFLYDGTRTEGISSVTDWALAVDVPLGISNAPMFRHINALASNVDLNQLSFKDVINSYPSSLNMIKKDWASCNFCKKLESIILTSI